MKNKIIKLDPVVTEKAVMMIELQNILTFCIDKRVKKDELKKEVEEIFNVKVKSVRTLVRGGRKYAYVKLNEKFLAVDIATKIGLM